MGILGSIFHIMLGLPVVESSEPIPTEPNFSNLSNSNKQLCFYFNYLYLTFCYKIQVFWKHIAPTRTSTSELEVYNCNISWKKMQFSLCNKSFRQSKCYQKSSKWIDCGSTAFITVVSNFKLSQWSKIVGVSVILRRTVWNDIDWHLNNLSGSRHDSDDDFHSGCWNVRQYVTTNSHQDYPNWDNHTLPTYDMTPGARFSKLLITFRAR